MSLRAFHRIFILIAIVGADLFGIWAIWQFIQVGDWTMLALGVVSLLGGLGLIVHLIGLGHFLEKAHIE